MQCQSIRGYRAQRRPQNHGPVRESELAPRCGTVWSTSGSVEEATPGPMLRVTTYVTGFHIWW